MLDNLSVHKATSILQTYKDLRITPIFGVPYTPDFNPVEGVFSIVKNYFAKQRLNSLANGLKFDLDKQIKIAF